MNAPLYKFGVFGDEASLVLAFVIGLGFGFFLERAGFGSARKLTGQFYFRDLAVLKVMFTAIVTAMVGAFWLSSLGLMDLSMVWLQPTYLWANIFGGLLLGFGFIIGGYCPGTSLVAFATGRIDALVYILGVLLGVVVLGELWPLLGDLPRAGAMGSLTLPQLLDLPHGLLVLAVVLMAIGAFVAAEWAEVRFGGVDRSAQPLLGAPMRSRNRSRAIMIGLATLGLLAAVAGDPYRGHRLTVDQKKLGMLVQTEADRVSVDDLASWIIEGRVEYRLLDLRSAEDHARYHIPGAESVPMGALVDAALLPQERVVLYSQEQGMAAQAWVLLKARGFPYVYALDGGMSRWRSQVLEPVLPAAPQPEQARELEAVKARALYFGGRPMQAAGAEGELKPVPLDLPEVAPSAPPPPAPSPPPAAPGGGRQKREGC